MHTMQSQGPASLCTGDRDSDGDSSLRVALPPEDSAQPAQWLIAGVHLQTQQH